MVFACAKNVTPRTPAVVATPAVSANTAEIMIRTTVTPTNITSTIRLLRFKPLTTSLAAFLYSYPLAFKEDGIKFNACQ